MGAVNFVDLGESSEVEQAFQQARAEAQHEYGHGGYTGTVAEKKEYVVIEAKPMRLAEAVDLATRLTNEGDKRIDDKWGPAGAIAVGEGGQVTRWLFFGWASS